MMSPIVVPCSAGLIIVFSLSLSLSLSRECVRENFISTIIIFVHKVLTACGDYFPIKNHCTTAIAKYYAMNDTSFVCPRSTMSLRAILFVIICSGVVSATLTKVDAFALDIHPRSLSLQPTSVKSRRLEPLPSTSPASLNSSAQDTFEGLRTKLGSFQTRKKIDKNGYGLPTTEERVPFIIQKIGRGNDSEIEEITRMCIDVFFNAQDVTDPELKKTA